MKNNPYIDGILVKDEIPWGAYWSRVARETEQAITYRGTPPLFGFRFQEDGGTYGHTILLTGVQEKGEYVVFEMYDENIPHEFQYLYVSKERYGVLYWGVSYDDPTPKEQDEDTYTKIPALAADNWYEILFWNADALNRMDVGYPIGKAASASAESQSMKMTSREAEHVVLEIDAYVPLRIENSKGEYLQFQNEEYTGTMEVLECRSVVENKAAFYLTVQPDTMFRVTDFEDNTRVGVQMEEEYYTASAAGANGMIFTAGKGIELKGEEYTFETGLSVGTEGDLMVHIGTSKGDSSVTREEDKIVLNAEETDGIYKNVSVEVSTLDGITSEKVDDEFPKAELSESGEIISVDGSTPGTSGGDNPAERDSIAGAAVKEIPIQRYTGQSVTPELQITYKDRGALKLNRDYSVSFSNNVNVGTVNVVIYGKGRYTGSITRQFRIVKQLYDDVLELYGWRYDAIKFVKDHGIMNGISGTNNFEPDSPLTRAMFATIIYRMNGSPAASYNGRFPDVPNGNYFSVPISWASSVGIINGHSNTGLFGTFENIAREDMVTIMYRYMKYKGQPITGRDPLTRFPDAGKVSAYAKDAMQWAVANGIITGRSNTGMLDPKGNATRVECAAIIQRFMSKFNVR